MVPPVPELTRLADYESISFELLRAIRGKRSQTSFARRLGYRANPITDWERGSRHPTAVEALRAAHSVGLPVVTAFQRLGSMAPPELDAKLRWRLHEWLSTFCGERSIVKLASDLDRSRHTVGRWLSGRAQPKLHELLRMIDVVSGRLHDWVSGLVPIESVPSLLPAFRRAQAARNIAFEQPWTEAILRVLETDAYREGPGQAHSTLAACLGIPVVTLEQALGGLVEAGVLERTPNGYLVVGQLSVDTRVGSASLRALQQHWLGVALERTTREQTRDWFAYNLISLSRADLVLVEECLKRAYRESRAIVAASQPCEVAGLVLMQLVRWE